MKKVMWCISIHVINLFVEIINTRVKSSMARNPQRRIESNELSTTCSEATEVAQWAPAGCSRPQPAIANGV